MFVSYVIADIFEKILCGIELHGLAVASKQSNISKRLPRSKLEENKTLKSTANLQNFNNKKHKNLNFFQTRQL